MGPSGGSGSSSGGESLFPKITQETDGYKLEASSVWNSWMTPYRVVDGRSIVGGYDNNPNYYAFKTNNGYFTFTLKSKKTLTGVYLQSQEKSLAGFTGADLDHIEYSDDGVNFYTYLPFIIDHGAVGATLSYDDAVARMKAGTTAVKPHKYYRVYLKAYAENAITVSQIILWGY